MKPTETVEQFYKRLGYNQAMSPRNQQLGLGHFNIFKRDKCAQVTNYSRRDFYKISLIIGTGRLHYANHWIYIDRPALLFSNPRVPYSWEAESAIQQGWFCLFTEAFMLHDDRTVNLQETPLFRVGARPVYFLDKAQLAEAARIFEKMETGMASNYPQKYSLMRSYIQLLAHEAMKGSTDEYFERQHNASARITQSFLELLERQFPIDSTDQVLQLRTPQDFAQHLSIHVNHLNRSVKQNTGKTTTGHITARVIQEGQALLQYSDWNIAQIAYGLGFQEPAHFTNFFKKQTGVPPAAHRFSMT